MKALSKLRFMLVIFAVIAYAAALPHTSNAPGARDAGIYYCEGGGDDGGSSEDDDGGKSFADLSAGRVARLG